MRYRNNRLFSRWVSVVAVLAISATAIAQVEDSESAEEAGKGAVVAAAVEAGKGAVSATVDTGRDVARGIGEATSEVGGTLKSGGSQVVQQSRNLWQDAMLPSLQRTAGVLPSVIKALILLLAFWIIGKLAGAGVTKLLSLVQFDNRLVKQLGLESMAIGSQGRKRSLEDLLGKLVKWLIILFGFVAFFNALNLYMVADPLQNVVDRIVGIVPNLLKAFAILIIYWIVATLVKLGLAKVLGAASFDERGGKYLPEREVKGEKLGPSQQVGRLFFYVILLFGIPPFLQALGQEALVAPLQDMLSKTLAFLPNIFAAAIIFFIGKIVATIVHEVVTNFLSAAGADTAAERLGFDKICGEKRLSGVIGLVAYFFILLPIIVSAVDSLKITAISDPVKATLESVLAAVPAILVAAVIVGIGYAIAKFMRGLVETFLSGIGFNAFPEKIGLRFLKPAEGKATLSSILATVVMAVILLLTAQQALDTLGFAQLSELVDGLVRYLPSLVAGIVILLAALSIGNYVGDLVGKATSGGGHSRLLSNVSKYAIFFLGASMALDQLGVGEKIVTTAVTAVLGGAALALGLAFGLGGKDKAKSTIDKLDS